MFQVKLFSTKTNIITTVYIDIIVSTICLKNKDNYIKKDNLVK